MASLVLALLPLHVNLSGRVLADTPLAFFVTLCFAAFYFAERSGNRALYLTAGLSLGAVYWVKEVVPPVILPVFLLYALIIARTFRKEWLWAIAGATLMLLLNMALMWGVAGDPLHVFHAANRAVPLLASLEADRSPGYYLHRLFFDVRHTWLMPFLAVGGALVCWRDRRASRADIGYVVLWGVGLLLTLSFTVISVSPFRLLSKHNQYMLIFAAPLALFAGYALAALKGKALVVVLTLLVGGSLLLSALQQQVIRVFTSNSRATIAFAAQHPGVPVYASTNAYTLSSTVSALGGEWPARTNIRPSAELAAKKPVPASADPGTSDGKPAAYVILDLETLARGREHLRITPEEVPPCWKYVETLQPQGFGVGRSVLGVLRRAAEIILPERLAQKALSATERIFSPRGAYAYAVPFGCNIERRGSG
jgi:4-amino-4-deoxy-L-arabinose transferase-like glycosyltransferase